MRQQKKDILSISLLLLATLVVFTTAYLSQPRPIVAKPEDTEILYIHVEFPNGDEKTWVPTSQQDQSLAREIVHYLANCREMPTFRRGPVSGYPNKTPCITIMLHMPQERMRGVVVSPHQLPEDSNGRVNYSYDAGPTPSYLTGFDGEILNPKEIYTFVAECIH